MAVGHRIDRNTQAEPAAGYRLLQIRRIDMINWIKYDPTNPPQESNQYVVLSGGNCPWTAIFNKEKRIWKDDCDFVEIEDVTHYAHINLPEEEDRP